MHSDKKNQGFTLIEILVVIGLIAVLATVVLVAINPGRQFAQARNSQRTSNVNTILNAIGQRIADNKGVFSGGTPNCPALPLATTTIASAGGSTDLSCLVPNYIANDLPFDPNASGAKWNSATDYDTKYSIVVDTNGRVTVTATQAEIGAYIFATR